MKIGVTVVNKLFKKEWTKFFSRAPADSGNCLDACFLGCHYRQFYN